jgi:hypothetical protein
MKRSNRYKCKNLSVLRNFLCGRYCVEMEDMNYFEIALFGVIM